MDATNLRIEHLKTIDQFRACEDLQRQAWGMDDRDVVPLHLLVTLEKNGGLVLGAFDDRGELVGTLFGFLGAIDRSAGPRPASLSPSGTKHCSHMMGVREDWRGCGVGYRLKCAQREHALRQGLNLVSWTFDPLESLNASLNIRKLGATCSTYLRDLYGEMRDQRNMGLGSDRFRLDWWVASRHVAERLEGAHPESSLKAYLDRGAVLLNEAEAGTGRLRDCFPPSLPPKVDLIAVEIPADIQSMKTTDLQQARRWRACTREIFESAFGAGYTVVDFVSEVKDGARRSFYLLQRGFEVDR